MELLASFWQIYDGHLLHLAYTVMSLTFIQSIQRNLQKKKAVNMFMSSYSAVKFLLSTCSSTLRHVICAISR